MAAGGVVGGRNTQLTRVPAFVEIHHAAHRRWPLGQAPANWRIFEITAAVILTNDTNN
jgi:hypothetical protein